MCRVNGTQQITIHNHTFRDLREWREACLANVTSFIDDYIKIICALIIIVRLIVIIKSLDSLILYWIYKHKICGLYPSTQY